MKPALILGAHPDRQDRRDRLYAPAPAKLPTSAVLPFLPPIRDQGQRPSCTGHAGAWVWQQFLASRFQQYQDTQMSAAWIWYHARREELRERQSTGASLRSVMKVLNKQGCPSEWLWPDGKPHDREPGPEAIISAAALRVPEYLRTEEIEIIKHAIAIERQAVLIGLPVFASWSSDHVRKTGRIQYDPTEEYIGGHALAACGYDDKAATLLVANSWGKNFGDDGFLHIPYDLLRWEAWDGWTVNFDAAPDSI